MSKVGGMRWRATGTGRAGRTTGQEAFAMQLQRQVQCKAAVCVEMLERTGFCLQMDGRYQLVFALRYLLVFALRPSLLGARVGRNMMRDALRHLVLGFAQHHHGLAHQSTGAQHALDLGQITAHALELELPIHPPHKHQPFRPPLHDISGANPALGCRVEQRVLSSAPPL